MRLHLALILILTSLFPFAASAQVNLDTASFNRLKSDLPLDVPNGLVVIGEAHDVKNTFVTEYFIIEQLVAKGFKNLYIESGHSEAAIYNYYFATGDTSCLHYTRAVHENQEFRTMMERLYQLNKKNNYGIVLNGFDFERNVSVNYLFHKWFNGVITRDIDFDKQLEKLLAIPDYGDRTYKRIADNSAELKTVLSEIKENFPKYEKQYMSILNENFPVFKSIVFNPYYFKSTGDKNRDKYMAMIMKEYEDGMDGEQGLNKSIIITGTYHIVTKDRFIPQVFNKGLSGIYVNSVFIPVYRNCTMVGEKPYKFSSDSYLLRCLIDKPSKPLVKFYRCTERLVPGPPEVTYSTILVGFYDQ
ncbi:MAG: hypothetical protein ACJ77K_09890 [Bacteroidia bacterium]